MGATEESRPSNTVSNGAGDRGTIRAVYAGFVLTGVLTTLLGALIPLLSAGWAIGDEKTGYLFTAQFAGSLLGVAITSRAFARLGLLRVITFSFFFMCVGVCVLGIAGWPWALGAVSFYGIGLGAAIPGINLLVAEATPARKAAVLNTLNFGWGIGAVAGPPLIAISARAFGLGRPLWILGLLLGLAGLLLLRQPDSNSGRPPARQRTSPAKKAEFTPALLLAAFIFLYVGAENSVGGWVASYADRLSVWPGYSWALATALFWGSLLAGRGIAPSLLRFIGQEKLVIAGLICAAAGNALLLAPLGPDSGRFLAAGIAATGLGFSAIYPISVAALSEFYEEDASRFSSLVFSMASLGGASLPWLTGLVSSKSGGLRVAFAVPLVASIAMIAVRAPIMWLHKRLETAQRPA
ncbi:MAG TPA: MFS transporter [Blastocatellia bacterium]|nr:MFS transporter [Blastocatellia bacterium]